jgi:hypothetical protein
VKKGLDAYESLYADSRKWLANGWLDYIAPQLYWAIESTDQSYPVLLDWWRTQNTKGRHLWPGSDLTKVGAQWPAGEIVKQIRLTRRQHGVSGNLLWNMTSLTRNQDALSDTLSHAVYGEPALVPASPWLEDTPPVKPKLKMQPAESGQAPKLTWTNPGTQDTWLWVCQSRIKGHWRTQLFPGDQLSWTLPKPTSPWYPDLVAITGVSRCGSTGATALLNSKVSKTLARKTDLNSHDSLRPSIPKSGESGEEEHLDR